MLYPNNDFDVIIKKTKQVAHTMDYNQSLTFSGLASAISNSINCTVQYHPNRRLASLLPALKFWVIKHLATNGFENLRVLPDRELKTTLFIKAHHGGGIARVYPTLGNGYFQMEIISPNDGVKLPDTVHEAYKKASQSRRPAENQSRLLKRLVEQKGGQ